MGRLALIDRYLAKSITVPLLGTLLLGEPFNSWVLAGTVLVLSGVWLLAKWR